MDGPRQTVVHFLQGTTVKGVSKAARARYTFSKVLWVFAVLFGTGVGTYFIHNLTADYTAHLVTTGMVEMQTVAPFPDVTVCNLNPLALIPHLAEDFEAHISRVDELLQDLKKQNISTKNMTVLQDYLHQLQTPYGFLQNISVETLEKEHVNVSALIVECEWETSDLNIHPQDCWKHVTKVYLNADFGICFTFTRPFKHALLNGFKLILFLNELIDIYVPKYDISISNPFPSGVRVVLHEKGTWPEISEGENLSPGTFTTLKVNPVLRTRLPAPFSTCEYREEFHSPDFEQNYSYSQAACFEDCFQATRLRSCGCLDGNLVSSAALRSRYGFCGALHNDWTARQGLDTIRCNAEASMKLNKDKKKFESDEETEEIEDNEDECECPLACEEYWYESRSFSASWPNVYHQVAFYQEYIQGRPLESYFQTYKDITEQMSTNKTAAFQLLRSTDLLQHNFLQVHITMASSQTWMVDRERLNLSTYIGSLGGMLNLWVGISFVTLIELIDFVYHLAISLRYNRKRNYAANESPMTNIDNNKT